MVEFEHPHGTHLWDPAPEKVDTLSDASRRELSAAVMMLLAPEAVNMLWERWISSHRKRCAWLDMEPVNVRVNPCTFDVSKLLSTNKMLLIKKR